MNNRPSSLIEAAATGDLKTVQKILSVKENDIDQADDEGTTALISAAKGKHENMVHALCIWGGRMLIKLIRMVLAL